MADFHTGEFHQDALEYFPMKSGTGKRSVSIPGSKLIAAVVTAAVAATMMLSTYVNCFATNIMPTSATLDVSVINPAEDTVVEWQLTDEDGAVIDSGQLDKNEKELFFNGLDPDTQYEISFTIPGADGGEPQPLSKYKFTTGKENKPGPAPTPPPGKPVTPAKPGSSPAPTEEPSPSPSVVPSPVVIPSPSPSASPTATPAPAATPKPKPSKPKPEAGTPYLFDVRPGADSEPSADFIFPFEMNSTTEYVNEVVNIAINVKSQGENGEFSDVYDVYDTEIATQRFEMPYNGSISAQAVLTYNRSQYDADGNLLGVEEGLTVTSDELAVSGVFINSRWTATGREGGITLNDIKVDENNVLTGTMVIDIETGTYATKNAVSNATIPYEDPEDGDFYPIRYTITDNSGRSIRGELDISGLTSTGEDVSTPFTIDLSTLGLTAGSSYTLEINAGAAWAVDGVVIGSSTGIGTAEFVANYSPAKFEETALDNYVTPTYPPSADNGNGINLIYNISAGDAEEISGIEVTDTVAWYDFETGRQIGSVNRAPVTYTIDDLSDMGNGLYELWHTGTANDSDNYSEDTYYDRNSYFRYTSKAEMDYVLNGENGTAVSDEFVLEPYFYINSPDNNTLTIDPDSVQVTPNGISVTISGKIGNIHAGENTQLDPDYLTVVAGEEGYYDLDLEDPAVTLGEDGSITITDCTVLLPPGCVQADGTLTMALLAGGPTYVYDAYGYSTQLCYSDTYAMTTITVTGGYTLSLADARLDNDNNMADSGMTLDSVILATYTDYGLDSVKVFGGETVWIEFALVGTPAEAPTALSAYVQITDPYDTLINYTDELPGGTFTQEDPYYITLEYVVPTDISEDIALQPLWYMFMQR